MRGTYDSHLQAKGVKPLKVNVVSTGIEPGTIDQQSAEKIKGYIREVRKGQRRKE